MKNCWQPTEDDFATGRFQSQVLCLSYFPKRLFSFDNKSQFSRLVAKPQEEEGSVSSAPFPLLLTGLLYYANLWAMLNLEFICYFVVDDACRSCEIEIKEFLR